MLLMEPTDFGEHWTRRGSLEGDTWLKMELDFRGEAAQRTRSNGSHNQFQLSELRLSNFYPIKFTPLSLLWVP